MKIAAIVIPVSGLIIAGLVISGLPLILNNPLLSGLIVGFITSKLLDR